MKSLAQLMWKAAYRVMRTTPPTRWRSALLAQHYDAEESERIVGVMRRFSQCVARPLPERALSYRLDMAWAKMRSMGLAYNLRKTDFKVVDTAPGRWLMRGQEPFGKERLILVEKEPVWWFVDVEPTRHPNSIAYIDESRKPRSVKTIGKKRGCQVKKIGHAYIVQRMTSKQKHQGFGRLERLSDYKVMYHGQGWTEVFYHNERVRLSGKCKWTVHFERGSLEELVTTRHETAENQE